MGKKIDPAGLFLQRYRESNLFKPSCPIPTRESPEFSIEVRPFRDSKETLN